MFRVRSYSVDILLGLLALLFIGALADVRADTLYITEFVGAPPTSVYYQAVKAPAVAEQTVAISGTSARSSAFAITTGIVRISTDVDCHVVIGGTAPTATTSSMRLVAGASEYFVVAPGDKVAVIVE